MRGGEAHLVKERNAYKMLLATNWQDYQVLDTGDGEKLERWGRYVLRRPDPQVIWPKTLAIKEWEKADAFYTRSATGGGQWTYRNRLPESWQVGYGALSFRVKTMGFKHTGLFPEQAVNWDWMAKKVAGAGRPVRVLNLFGYTGGATVALAAAGAQVVHVDAAKNMVAAGKENLQLSGLGDRPVRWIVDDCLKFVQREQRRGRQYEGILMDPPSYGRGPGGEVWKLENEVYGLIGECVKVLSDAPVFFLINSYTTGLQSMVLYDLMQRAIVPKFGGRVSADEIGLPIKDQKMLLPCGTTGRWEADR